MSLAKLRTWLLAVASGLGGVGILVVALLDSSVLTFPVINDLLVMNNSIQHPALMPYYAAMASIGSILGCVILYFLARKGGQAFFKKRAGDRGSFIQRWLERNGFGTVLLAALLPPPAPFKIVVIGAGVYRVPFRAFFFAIVISRVVRYFGEGLLAMYYGERMIRFFEAHPAVSGSVLLGAVAVIYFLTRVLLHYLRRKA